MPSTNRSNIVRSFIFLLLCSVILVPRIPIIPLGYGELSLRIDGVTSALLGILSIYKLRSNIIIIPIFFVGFLYLNGSNSFAISLGLFLQVISILLLPKIFSTYARINSISNEDLLNRLAVIIVGYSVVNVIIAVISRYFLFQYCVDASTDTGCIGGYGLLDRPYVFAIFIGSSFVFLCASKWFSFTTAIILLFGLLISDSRSIALIMVVLGVVAFLIDKKLSFRKILYFGMILSILMIAMSFGGGKMSFENSFSGEADPSWLMRLYSIERYIEWVDLSRFVFGSGALAFYQFSEQYGVPGPIDNLYFRLASEIGIIGIAIISLTFIYPLVRLAKKNFRFGLLFFYVLSISIISIFQESLIVSRSGHVLSLLGIYLACAIGASRPVRQLSKRRNLVIW